MENAGAAVKCDDNIEVTKTLTDLESMHARLHGALPACRTAIYTAHTTMKEEQRLEMWKIGTLVSDDPKQIVSWANAQVGWNQSADSGDDGVEGDDIDSGRDKENEEEEEEDNGKILLKLTTLRAQVGALEAEKNALIETSEAKKEQLRAEAYLKHEELEKSITCRIQELQSVASQMRERLGVDASDSVDPGVTAYASRDCAKALAWWSQTSTTMVNDDIPLGRIHYNALRSELIFLNKMALAAKVVTKVTSPLQKKLLNLCFTWLSTFLPHCLAKVNRVSFGLLNDEDCKAALLADPNVPRSRLKLAVPFIGKDVPSKSSEFAHPDIIIGLTVLAYR